MPLTEPSEDSGRSVTTFSSLSAQTYLKAYRPASLITQSSRPFLSLSDQIPSILPTGSANVSSSIRITSWPEAILTERHSLTRALMVHTVLRRTVAVEEDVPEAVSWESEVRSGLSRS